MFETAQQFHRTGWNRAEVGDIREFSDAKTVNRERRVLCGNGDDFRTKQIESSIQSVELDLRNRAFCALRLENIGKSAAQNFQRLGGRVDGNGRPLFCVEGTNVIEAENVIGMSVSEKNAIQALEIGAKCLLAKIGRGVHDNFPVIVGE